MKPFIVLYLPTGEAKDYPKDMPIPRVGEQIVFEGVGLEVTMVRHLIEGEFKETEIITRSI